MAAGPPKRVVGTFHGGEGKARAKKGHGWDVMISREFFHRHMYERGVRLLLLSGGVESSTGKYAQNTIFIVMGKFSNHSQIWL